MSFIKHGEKNGTIFYEFENEGVNNVFYIKRKNKIYNGVNFTENLLFWGVIKDNKFTTKQDSGNLNLYNLRSIIFEILEDFERSFVSERYLELYVVKFSKKEDERRVKRDFAYKSMRIKYGDDNTVLDISDTITVFLNKEDFPSSYNEISETLVRA